MKLLQLVERLCVKKIADILRKNVDCSRDDRTETDWLTAETLVMKRPDAVHIVFQEFVPQSTFPGQDPERVSIWDVPFDIRYEAFDRLCGQAVWDHLYQKIKDMLPQDLYPRIRH